MIDSTDLSNVVAAQVVVFSSVAALIGAGGQASYVSANAGLDAWAQRRCDTGVWGGRVWVWGGGGQASQLCVGQRGARRVGTEAL